MNRRSFFWHLAAGLQGTMVSLAAARSAASARDASAPCGSLPDGLGLRDVARRKLHHRAGGFVNPFCRSSYRRFGQLLRWKLFSPNRYKHLYPDEIERPVLVDWPALTHHGGLSVTFLNHASVLIRDPARSLLIDPIFSGLLPFIHDFTPLRFAENIVPRPDEVLITHGHYDHLDKPTLQALDPAIHVVTPLGYDALMDEIGLRHHTRLDWFETAPLGDWRLTLMPSHHWTMRNPFTGPNTALWGGYLIETASGRTIYYSGDTADFDGFSDIGREADIDLAIICLGAYAPRWFMAGSHIDPARTVEAFRRLGARRLMAVHWGTFRLGDEPVHLPPLELAREMERAGLRDRLVHLEAGETLDL